MGAAAVEHASLQGSSCPRVRVLHHPHPQLPQLPSSYVWATGWRWRRWQRRLNCFCVRAFGADLCFSISDLWLFNSSIVFRSFCCCCCTFAWNLLCSWTLRNLSCKFMFFEGSRINQRHSQPFICYSQLLRDGFESLIDVRPTLYLRLAVSVALSISLCCYCFKKFALFSTINVPIYSA